MGNSYFPTDPWVCCQAGLLCLDNVSTCSSTRHHVITSDDYTLRGLLFLLSYAARLVEPALCRHLAVSRPAWRTSRGTAGCRQVASQLVPTNPDAWKNKNSALPTCRSANDRCVLLHLWKRLVIHSKNSMDAWIFHLFSDPEINPNQI